MEERVEAPQAETTRNLSTSSKSEVIGSFIGMGWWVSVLELDSC